jgi:hypothetical protein
MHEETDLLNLGLELNQDMLICPLRQDQLLLSLMLIRSLCCLPPCLAPLQAAGDLLCARDQIAWTCTAPCTKNSPATSTKNPCARTTEGDQTKIQHGRNKIESIQPPRGQEEEKASFPIDLQYQVSKIHRKNPNPR